MSEDLSEVRRAAVGLLARREHTREELRTKLRQRHFDDDAVVQVLDELQSRGLQSDVRFAEQFVELHIRKGHGPVRILQELRQRGVNETIAGENVELDDPQWMARIREVRAKRFGTVPAATMTERARQARFLEYRGFTAAQISRLLRERDNKP